MRKLRLMFVLPMLLTAAVLAQEVQTGTIEGLDQDNGSLIISGQRVGFADSITQILWEGLPLGAHRLDQGMVVRYTLNEAGVLLWVEVIGPAEKLQELQRN
ncbi:MAG: hypothetical protein H7A05_01610 [Pseudomonadales bacterium]|nr:hypothetical protein [Pseudomonadales bacterium]MCP5330915.1 hypothetical protein [Pseudomonadales bacterium]MCP5343295.1 hypothetical protein [Pseudomonadales bacterium]